MDEVTTKKHHIRRENWVNALLIVVQNMTSKKQQKAWPLGEDHQESAPRWFIKQTNTTHAVDIYVNTF